MVDDARCTPREPGPRGGAVSRRGFLAAGGLLAGGLIASACGTGRGGPAGSAVGPDSTAVAAAERRRPRSGRTLSYTLEARRTQVDLGGPVVDTWAYGDTVPGPLIRARPGDELQVRVANGLPAPTSVHWHGLTVENSMDGVPPLTQRAIPAGSAMLYHFVVPPAPGTYWYHPHVGLQEDRGLYGPLVVDDPAEAGAYDVEFVVVLDDWVDGTGGRTPETVYAALRAGKGMGGSGMGGSGMGGSGMGGSGMGGSGMAGSGMGGSGMGGSGMGGSGAGTALGADAADVAYPYYLVNGRIAAAPVTLGARPGQRARFRIINSAASTGFRVALGGHRMTVTHTDGYPVRPVTVDSLVLGMAERYDVTVTLGDGAFPFLALPLGAPGQAMAVVRTGSGATPSPTVRPAELGGELLPVDLSTLEATAAVQTPAWTPEVTHDLVLSGGMGSGYTWTINGRAYPDHAALPVRQGQRTRLRLSNRSMMFHPMHLHGHTFQVRAAGGGAGPRKDTVNVLPMRTVVVDFVADNPGQWVVHCHNLYHQEAGMMTVLSYRT